SPVFTARSTPLTISLPVSSWTTCRFLSSRTANFVRSSTLSGSRFPRLFVRQSSRGLRDAESGSIHGASRHIERIEQPPAVGEPAKAGGVGAVELARYKTSPAARCGHDIELVRPKVLGGVAPIAL